MEYLDLLDNEIGLLGCEFLSKILHPVSTVPLLKLKLDHNAFGTAGLRLLTQGLASNCVLEKLSLCYCGINAEGAVYIQEILANINSKLQKLKIQGNLFMNEGVEAIFRALEINEELQKINVADNQLNLTDAGSEDLIELIIQVLGKNPSMIHYNFKFNVLGDEVGFKIIEQIEVNKNLYRVELPDNM